MFEEFSKNYLASLKQKIDELDTKKVHEIIEVILKAHHNNRHIFIFGNGGSASTSSHFATDLGKGSIKDWKDRSEKRLKVTSLTDNVALLTA